MPPSLLPKAVAAARKIAAFNSEIAVEPHIQDLVPENINALLDGMNVILDGTDNFETRYLVNDYAIKILSRGFMPPPSEVMASR